MNEILHPGRWRKDPGANEKTGGWGFEYAQPPGCLKEWMMLSGKSLFRPGSILPLMLQIDHGAGDKA